MTWTYSGDPGSRDIDKVRWIIQDIDPNRPLVSDEEILYALRNFGNPEGAATEVIRKLIQRFSQTGRVRLGRFEYDPKPLLESLKDVLAQLQSVTEVWAGGLSKSEVIDMLQDTDLIQPSFTKDQHSFTE